MRIRKYKCGTSEFSGLSCPISCPILAVSVSTQLCYTSPYGVHRLRLCLKQTFSIRQIFDQPGGVRDHNQSESDPQASI